MAPASADITAEVAQYASLCAYYICYDMHCLNKQFDLFQLRFKSLLPIKQLNNLECKTIYLKSILIKVSDNEATITVA